MQHILFTCLYNLLTNTIRKASGLFSDFWRSDFMSNMNEAQWTMLTNDEKIMLVLVVQIKKVLEIFVWVKPLLFLKQH